MFSGILLMSAKWYMIYCNGVIVMVCADGITITALQYFMPILKSSHFFVQSSFDHPSFILRSSFDWGLEDDYWSIGESLREILFFGCRLCCHGDFFGIGQTVVADCVVCEVDAVEGLGEGVESLLAAVGLELTFPDGDAVPAH